MPGLLATISSAMLTAFGGNIAAEIDNTISQFSNTSSGRRAELRQMQVKFLEDTEAQVNAEGGEAQKARFYNLVKEAEQYKVIAANAERLTEEDKQALKARIEIQNLKREEYEQNAAILDQKKEELSLAQVSLSQAEEQLENAKSEVKFYEDSIAARQRLAEQQQQHIVATGEKVANSVGSEVNMFGPHGQQDYFEALIKQEEATRILTMRLKEGSISIETFNSVIKSLSEAAGTVNIDVEKIEEAALAAATDTGEGNYKIDRRKTKSLNKALEESENEAKEAIDEQKKAFRE